MRTFALMLNLAKDRMYPCVCYIDVYSYMKADLFRAKEKLLHADGCFLYTF